MKEQKYLGEQVVIPENDLDRLILEEIIERRHGKPGYPQWRGDGLRVYTHDEAGRLPVVTVGVLRKGHWLDVWVLSSDGFWCSWALWKRGVYEWDGVDHED